MPEFELKCNYCGKVLDGDFYVIKYKPTLEVEPCETCMDRCRDEGYDEGQKE